MARPLILIPLLVLGYALGRIFQPDGIESHQAYLYGTSLLLAVGLYGVTYGIDHDQLRRDRARIGVAVSVGVLAKAVLIGGALFIVTHSLIALLLGVVVAQIDPVSVGSIVANRRLSKRAYSILAAWSSFDDAVTAILAVYASLLVGTVLDSARPTLQGLHVGRGLAAYAAGIALNLALAGVAYLVWRMARNSRRADLIGYALLLVVGAVATWQFLMLAMALVGLFIRPRPLARALPRLVTAALVASTILLGVLLTTGIDLVAGIVLGLGAFGAQIVVALALTPGLPRRDRTHLALAQQNGLTAIVLALRLDSQFGGVVAAVAPAIVIANLAYVLANRILDWRESRPQLVDDGANVTDANADRDRDRRACQTDDHPRANTAVVAGAGPRPLNRAG